MKKSFIPFDVIPEILTHAGLKVNAFHFIPKALPLSHHRAIFTHGFTACKNDVVPWAFRLLDLGISSTIFDLPGHLLGAFYDSPPLTTFLEQTPELFSVAATQQAKVLKDRFNIETMPNNQKLILGGHSLGALFSIQAASRIATFPLEIDYVVAVGFGLNPLVKTHLFESELYQKTLHLRSQLIAPTLEHDKVFKWIKEQKLDLELKKKKVLLLCGKDDAVVGSTGADILYQMMQTFNEVTLEKPDQLPHHRPELAAAHLFHYFKKQLAQKIE
jgi:hypothetical protein